MVQNSPVQLGLKESGDMDFLMTRGRLFHKVGPAWAKARSPQVFVDFGTTREPELDEHKDLTGVYSWTKLILQWGAEHLRQWKKRSKILKTMQSLTWNQWSDCRRVESTYPYSLIHPPHACNLIGCCISWGYQYTARNKSTRTGCYHRKRVAVVITGTVGENNKPIF